jgi:hypothetical protein
MQRDHSEASKGIVSREFGVANGKGGAVYTHGGMR